MMTLAMFVGIVALGVALGLGRGADSPWLTGRSRHSQRPACGQSEAVRLLTGQWGETAMGWLWILFMVLMGAIPIALVILAVVMIPRRRKSENADSHVEWWTPPNH
jgi:hypothetical protein